MGRGSRSGGQYAARRPVDLTGIISVAERNDLITLVNAITENMLQGLSNMFDSPPIRPVQGEPEHHHWLSLSLLHRRESNKENLPSIESCEDRSPGSYSTMYSATHELIKKEENDAMTPQLRELKKEALAFFRKWQTLVLQRLREISINDVASCPGGSRGRGRGTRGPRGGRGVRGGRNNQASSTLAIGPPRIPTNHIDPTLAMRHPPIPNTLWTTPVDKRKLLLHIMLLLIVSFQEYNANSRILLVNLTSSLNLPFASYIKDEIRLAEGFYKAALETPSGEDELAKLDEAKVPRKWKLGIGSHGASNNATTLASALKSVGIGAAQGGFGLTSSAAAGLMGIMAENGILMGAMFGINPSRPISRMLETFSREIQDFAFLRLAEGGQYEYRDAMESLPENRRLRVLITISGCLADSGDIVGPWRCLGLQSEVYAVRWEATALTNLGSALETVIKSTAWESARKGIESQTIFKSLIDSIWPESLLKISKIIDNPWSVGMVRAEKAGAVLADSLIRHKFQGERPVSLIGYSLAARVIYACLMVLAERRQFGVVDSVVMIGTPAPSESRVWLTLKSVVSGRLVNVYSEHDYILGFLYRTSNIQFGVAGLQEIQGANGVENHCVQDLAKGHLSYPQITAQILKDIGWEDVNVKPVSDQTMMNRGSRAKQNTAAAFGSTAI